MRFLEPFWARNADYQQWATEELWQRRVELWKWYGGPDSYGVDGKAPEWLRSQIPSSQDLWFYARDLVWWYCYEAGEMAGRDLPRALKMAREIPTPECCRQRTEAFTAIASKTLTDESFREAYGCARSTDEPFRRILRTDDRQAARALFERKPDSRIKRQVQASYANSS